MFESDNSKKDSKPDNGCCKEDWDGNYKKECKHNDDECCACINIFCDKCKKEYRSKESNYDFDCKKEHKDNDESCVTINIYCDSNKK